MKEGQAAVGEKRLGIWEAAQCALVLVDYQPEMIDHMNGHDPRLVEVDVRTLATMAVLGIPVVLSTVGAERGSITPRAPRCGLRSRT